MFETAVAAGTVVVGEKEDLQSRRTIVPMKYNAHEEISRYFFFWVLMQPCSFTTRE